MIRRLTRDDEHTVEEVLEAEPVPNLFLLGFLGVHPLDRAWWYGAMRGDRVDGLVMVLPDRLAVPWIPGEGDAVEIGQHLNGLHEPCLLVGPRQASDGLWEGLASGVKPLRRYDQRLYVLREQPGGHRVPGFRKARLDDQPQVAYNAGVMEEEDLGINPETEDPALHAQVVRERIQAGRTWVIEQNGDIVFQINIGTSTPWGCQVGGTWVPHEHRGKGLATAGCRRLMNELLRHHPLVTLHVNEANLPAVRVYEKVGFVRDTAFRLITVKEVR